MVSIRYIAFALVVAAFGWSADAGAQVTDYAVVEYEDGNGAVTNARDAGGAVISDDAIDNGTYDERTILEEAGDFFGSGAQGLGKIVEKIFADLGRPSGYIKGTEGSAALVFGLRYGSGELAHKIEGNRPVHWTGPSVGIDAGGNLSKTLVAGPLSYPHSGPDHPSSLADLIGESSRANKSAHNPSRIL